MKFLAEPPAICLGELALRVATRPGPGDWLACVVATPRDASTVAVRLAEEVEALAGTPARAFEAASAEALRGALEAAGGAIAVVSGPVAFDDAAWYALDLHRSQLQRDHATVLALTLTALDALNRSAPNLASWIGGSAWRCRVDADHLSDAQRETRLAALREQAGLADSEVVALAQSGRLPPEPWYAEWLVLIGRGDLLGRP